MKQVSETAVQYKIASWHYLMQATDLKGLVVIDKSKEGELVPDGKTAGKMTYERDDLKGQHRKAFDLLDQQAFKNN